MTGFQNLHLQADLHYLYFVVRVHRRQKLSSHVLDKIEIGQRGYLLYHIYVLKRETQFEFEK